MYIVKLSKTPTTHANVYIKRALVVLTNYYEYDHLLASLALCNGRLRKKRIYYSNNITNLVPNNGTTWLVYVEYRYAEAGDWEQDLRDIFAEATPRIRVKAQP